MVQINFGQREVSCKLVFYGPGMSGKTTNLEIIHKKAPREAVGEMVSIATETDRTLYFDFLPLDLGQVAGMRTKFQLYTVPGQIYYNATRKLVLQGCDGVIFVADSAPDKMAENLESLQNLRDNLAEMGLTIDDPSSPGYIPIVLQYNKRDLPNAMSVAEMNAQLNPKGFPVFEACAKEGKGVFATLKEASRLVIEKLNREHGPSARMRRSGTQGGAPTPPGPAPAVQAAPPPAPPPAPPVVAAPTTRPAAAPAPPPPPPPPPAPPLRPPPPPVPPPVPPVAAVPPRPAAPAPATPVVPVAPPASPAAAAEPADPRERHLQKPKPPALGAQPPGHLDPGATDPNLKRYQAQAGGTPWIKILLIIFIFLLIALVLMIGLALFVPAVRALLPLGLQQRIEALTGGPPASPVLQQQIVPAPPAPLPAASPREATP